MKTPLFLCTLFSLQLAATFYCALPTSAAPPSADDLFNQADAAEAARKPDLAISLLKRGLTLRPRTKNAYLNLATLYARDKKDLSSAERMITKAVALDPYDFDIQWVHAMILTGQNRFREAKLILQRAAKIPHSSTDESKRLAKLSAIDKQLAHKP